MDTELQYMYIYIYVHMKVFIPAFASPHEAEHWESVSGAWTVRGPWQVLPIRRVFPSSLLRKMPNLMRRGALCQS